MAQEPPPRPTLVPPTPTPEPGHTDSPRPTPIALGRITGTVIDLTTGAPVSGVRVVVGDTTVTSDSNGNYDRNGLPAGSYQVALVLAEGQGTPAQDTITITLAAGATVVQHLAFRSPAAPLPTLTPTRPAGGTPSVLPPTGTAPETQAMPSLLPITGSTNSDVVLPWLMIIGVLLILAGASLWYVLHRYQRS